jgi:DNA-binding NtrC family response regulator
MLLITEDSSLRSVVQEVISGIQGLSFDVVKDHEEATERVTGQSVGLVMSHLNATCNVAGLTRLLGAIAATAQKVPVLVLSDEYHAQQALTLLRLGIADYLSRPLDLGRLGYLIDVLTLSSRHRAALPEPAAAPVSAPAVATAAPAAPQSVTLPEVSLVDGDEPFLVLPTGRMGQLVEQIRRIAPQDTTILLGGETGTGKTRLAGVIHRLSARRDKPFLTINCGALSANLIESEMFGHVKGAFTSADANRVGKFTEVGQGTLFLDEIDSLPPALQAKLLRAVEERVFEPVGSNKTQKLQARLIVASNRPLEQEVASGRFRADLYYRLNVVAFQLPPLRDRGDGIAMLAQGFLTKFARPDQPKLSIAPEVLRALEAHNWPGNIRELRNVIERAVALSSGPMIQLEDLPATFSDPGPSVSLKLADSSSSSVSTLAESTEMAERDRIEKALVRNGNNRLRAAAELGISRMTLYNKLRKLGVMAS